MELKYGCGILSLLTYLHISYARPSDISDHHKTSNSQLVLSHGISKRAACDSCQCKMCPAGEVCVDGNGFSVGTHCIPHSVYVLRMQELQKIAGQHTAKTSSGSGAVVANTQSNNNGQQGSSTGQTGANTGGVNVGTGTQSNTQNTGVQPAAATINNPAVNANSGTSGGGQQSAAINTNPAVNGGGQKGATTKTPPVVNVPSGTILAATKTNPAVNVNSGTNVNQQVAATSKTNSNPVANVKAATSTRITFPPTSCSTCMCMEKTNACPQGYRCQDLEDGVSVGAKCVKSPNTQQGSSTSQTNGPVSVNNGGIVNSGTNSQPSTGTQPGGSTGLTHGNTPLAVTNNGGAAPAATISQINTNNQPGGSTSQTVANAPVSASATNGQACPINACTDGTSFVCGTDGRTYQNMCQLIAAFCNNNSIRLHYHGECNVQAMVLKSRCGACTCPDQVGGCEQGFTCMTRQEGFVTEDGAFCIHESLLTNQNTAGNAGSVTNVIPANVQSSVPGTAVTVEAGYKCSVTGVNACFHKGYCNNGGTCQCPWKYSGRRCESLVTNPKRPCEAHPCQVNQVCVDQDIGWRCLVNSNG